MEETKKAESKSEPRARKAAAPEFPFDDDHYFSTANASRRSHHGAGIDAEHVKRIQSALGIRVTGEFDERTAKAVGKWQEANDLPSTQVVDRDTWVALHK